VSPFAHPDLFWPVERFAAAVGTPGVRVVDCRAALDPAGDPVDMHADYLAGHLPGAVHCQWTSDLSIPVGPEVRPRFMLLGAGAFAAAMSRLGIGDDTMVLAYDHEGGHHSARLWLALRAYGHDRFALLNGGLAAWKADGRPLIPGEVTAPRASFMPKPRAGVLADKADVRDALKKGDPWLLDVRRPTEYSGEERRAKRLGHIPGAVNIVWRAALNDDWTLKSADELERLYGDAGFGPDTATITYCQGGVRAAFTQMVLHTLGYEDVRTYDGSWDEWGNDPDVPIVRG